MRASSRILTRAEAMSQQEELIELLQQREAELAAEINALNRLYRLSAQLLRPTELKSAMELILDGSMEIVGATMGDIQIYDSFSQTMNILAHRGFTEEFITRLEKLPVDPDAPCSLAMASGNRVIVEDMESYPKAPSIRAT